MIESLNSPHVARVKALIGSRGRKERRALGQFVAEGIQCFREAITSQSGPRIHTLYLTQAARVKVDEITDLSLINTFDVSDGVMAAMSETVTPQGILAICTIPRSSLDSIVLTGTGKFIYLSEVQDPGPQNSTMANISRADASGRNMNSSAVSSPHSPACPG